jgi:hypothetical protein
MISEAISIPSAIQPDAFDRLLRRAAAYCWLTTFERQTQKGVLAMSQTQIGETAGSIWQILSKQGPLTFAALMDEINAPQSLFFMAIGWLSREDKLEFEPSGGDYALRLK